MNAPIKLYIEAFFGSVPFNPVLLFMLTFILTFMLVLVILIGIGTVSLTIIAKEENPGTSATKCTYSLSFLSMFTGSLFHAFVLLSYLFRTIAD